jgi:uncharacterized protein
VLLSPLLVVIVLLIGALIGGIGIGGVLLLPAMKYLGDFTLHQLIPACMLAYLFTGLIGASMYARQGSIKWRLALLICLGALPGAYLGALLLPYISSTILESVIAVLILIAGLDALFMKKPVIDSRHQVSSFGLMFIGFITGIGSALSGTGGPLLLIPILLWKKVAIMTAIGLAQSIMIPISTSATVGNFLHGQVDFTLGIFLGFLLGVGSIVGAKTAHLLPVSLVKSVVAVLLVLVGLIILSKLHLF